MSPAARPKACEVQQVWSLVLQSDGAATGSRSEISKHHTGMVPHLACCAVSFHVLSHSDHKQNKNNVRLQDIAAAALKSCRTSQVDPFKGDGRWATWRTEYADTFLDMPKEASSTA